MTEFLNELFAELLHPKVQFLSKLPRKQVNLFEIENAIEIQFNGFRHPQSYQEHLDRHYRRNRDRIEELILSEIKHPAELKKRLDIAGFEIKSFRKRFYPKNNSKLLLGRVDILKSQLKEINNNETLKGIIEYFSLEHNLLLLIEKLYKHRVQHIEQYYQQPAIIKTAPHINIPSNKKLSAYHLGRLSLFPKDSGITLMQWNRSKVDFIELITALYESNSIKTIDQRKLTKKDFFKFFIWVFNVQIGNWEATLYAAKNRKLHSGSPYLKELLAASALHANSIQK